MEIIRLKHNDKYWDKAIDFAENCSWVAGKHLSGMMRDNRFTDWESVFFAVDKNNIYGYCTFLKEDYYPENRYSPWISCIFVTENARGKRISHDLIACAIDYAKKMGFQRFIFHQIRKDFMKSAVFNLSTNLKVMVGMLILFS